VILTILEGAERNSWQWGAMHCAQSLDLALQCCLLLGLVARGCRFAVGGGLHEHGVVHGSAIYHLNAAGQQDAAPAMTSPGLPVGTPMNLSRQNARSDAPGGSEEDQSEPTTDEYSDPKRQRGVVQDFASELDPPGRVRAAASYREARDQCSWETQPALDLSSEPCYRYVSSVYCC
jgi:hypothetical protein